MTRQGLTLLIGMGLILSAQEAWSDTTGAASPTTVAVPVGASAATPMAVTSAAPAAVSAPVAQAGAPAAGTAAAPAVATAQAAASTASTSAPSTTSAPAAASATATPAAAAAPESAPAAAPAETSEPAPAPNLAIQVPVRGMDMANVEHIFGTPLQKQDAVGKPPITRWVYADYVVYFEYNKVLHTVFKSAPFQSPNVR